MRHGWAYLLEQVHAEGGDLPGRHRAVSSRAVQQHFGSQGELSGLVRLCAARRTGLRKRWKRLQVHVSDETAHLRVSARSAIGDRCPINLPIAEDRASLTGACLSVPACACCFLEWRAIRWRERLAPISLACSYLGHSCRPFDGFTLGIFNTGERRHRVQSPALFPPSTRLFLVKCPLNVPSRRAGKGSSLAAKRC